MGVVIVAIFVKNHNPKTDRHHLDRLVLPAWVLPFVSFLFKKAFRWSVPLIFEQHRPKFKKKRFPKRNLYGGSISHRKTLIMTVIWFQNRLIALTCIIYTSIENLLRTSLWTCRWTWDSFCPDGLRNPWGLFWRKSTKFRPPYSYGKELSPRLRFRK